MITITKTHVKTSAAFLLAATSVVLSAIVVTRADWNGISVTTTPAAYYIDCAGGSDANVGISPETAWKSISQLLPLQQNVGLKPGDAVYLKRGSTCKETLQIYFSGASGSPITIGAYGTGDAPVIDGENVRPWNIMVQNLSYITIRDLKVVNAKSDTGPSAGLVVYNSSNVIVDNVIASNNYGYGGIYVLANTAGAGDNNKVTNCQTFGNQGTTYSQAVTNGYNYGTGINVYVNGSGRGSNTEISNNQVYGNGGQGISFSGANGKITGNTAYNNGDSGISLNSSYTSDNIISYNTVYNNCLKFDDRAGINLYKVGSNNKVQYNKTYGQHNTYNDSSSIIDAGNSGQRLGSQGIRFDGGSDGTTGTSGNAIIYNVIYNEGDGIQIYNFANVAAYNNTVYNSKRFGIVLGGALTTGAQVKNNIISTMALGSTSGSYKMLLGIVSATNNIIDYNLYYPGKYYTKPAGQDVKSLISDPQFVSASGYDFSLQATSPAINNGVAVLATDYKDYAGIAMQGSAPDMGAYEFNGDFKGTPACTPTTCAAQGKNCGNIPNNCGGTLSCGFCSTAQSCINNICVNKCTLSAYPYYNPRKNKCCKSKNSSTCITPQNK